MAYTQITVGPPITLVDTTNSPGATGTVFAMPARRVQLTWQVLFASAPASVTCKLMGSDDGTNFIALDTTTAVAGDVRTVNTSVRFIRVDFSAISGGTGAQVIVVAKA